MTVVLWQGSGWLQHSHRAVGDKKGSSGVELGVEVEMKTEVALVPECMQLQQRLKVPDSHTRQISGRNSS